MEMFSDEFVRSHASVLKHYYKEVWGGDLLHIMVRPWEYLYAFLRIEEALTRYTQSEEIKVMDMGSGLTFFPFWLAHSHPKVRIMALDSDSSFDPLFKSILAEEKKYEDRVYYVDDDPITTKARREKFDIIYGISSIAQMTNYQKMIQNIKDLLNPGGTFVVTFELSIDHQHEVGEERALAFICELNKQFCDVDTFPVSISERIRIPEPMWSSTNIKRLTKAILKMWVPDKRAETTVVTATFRKCK